MHWQVQVSRKIKIFKKRQINIFYISKFENLRKQRRSNFKYWYSQNLGSENNQIHAYKFESWVRK